MEAIECNTVGELVSYLSQFPTNKPIIVDVDGNTMPVSVGNWSNAEKEDLNWPVAIFVT